MVKIKVFFKWLSDYSWAFAFALSALAFSVTILTPVGMAIYQYENLSSDIERFGKQMERFEKNQNDIADSFRNEFASLRTNDIGRLYRKVPKKENKGHD